MAASTTPSSRRRSRSRWRRSCPGRAAWALPWTPPAACCTCTSPPRPSSTATVRQGACGWSCMKPAHDCPGAAGAAAGCTAAGAALSTPHDVPLRPAPPAPAVKSPNILLDDSWHAKVGQLGRWRQPDAQRLPCAAAAAGTCALRSRRARAVRCARPLHPSPQVCDFGLSAILRHHTPEAHDAGATNPTWLVRRRICSGALQQRWASGGSTAQQQTAGPGSRARACCRPLRVAGP